MKRTLAALAAIIAAACLCCAGAWAQTPNPHARELARQLAGPEMRLRELGFARVAGPISGAAPAGAAAHFPMTLRAAEVYAVLGVCEGACAAMDVRIIDPAGAVLSERAVTRAPPAFVVRPTRTGAHRIEVRMDECAAQTCAFAFNIYGR